MFPNRTPRRWRRFSALASIAVLIAFAIAGCSHTDEDGLLQPTAASFEMNAGMHVVAVAHTCPSLPAGPVDATYAHPGTISFFNTTLNGIPFGFDVADGVYAGWCVEDNFRDNTLDPATMHCSLDASLPGNLGDYPWDKVNYLLNHKAGTPNEIEAAMWVLVWGRSDTFPVTAAAQAMVDDANANGSGYAPAPGEIIAVILYTGDGGIGPNGFQDTIIEVIVPRVPPELGSIGDQVWCDANENGLMDSGEAGISGVTIDLVCAGDDGVLDTADDILLSTTTDADGMYLFIDLPAGDCRVTVDTSSVPQECNEDGECPVDYTYTLGEGEDWLDADFCFTPPPPPGSEGCTPGYWKNHPGAWDTTDYATEMMVGSVFAESVAYPDLYAATLMQGLSFKGGKGDIGGARILLRAAIASLLNASSGNVEFPRSVGSIIGDVDAALASGDREAMLDLATALDTDNNAGCMLGRMGARILGD